MTIYPYASGDLIEHPNTYFYSQYHGREFIDAWQECRAITLAKLPEAIAPPEVKKTIDRRSRNSAELLERALEGDKHLREAFIKKFEIHKRLHDGYDTNFRALDIKARRSLSLYLRAADVFQLTYQESQALRHLNVYLKCIDTLCSMVSEMSNDLLARLAWHLGKEREFFYKLIATNVTKDE